MKVLIVTNLHHSSPRIPGIVRYFPEYGVQATVVTPPITRDLLRHAAPPADAARSMRLIEAVYPETRAALERSAVDALQRMRHRHSALPLPLIRTLTSLYREVAWFPDRDRRWVPFAYRAASRVLSREPHDVIITSSSPVSCHVVGHRLQKEFKLPWIAEFRDLWSQNHAYPYSILRRFIERRFEKRTLSTADSLVTVARPWALRLHVLHGKTAHVVQNGFDGTRYRDRPPLTRKFTITYTGQIYSNKQDPRKICHAIRELADEGLIDLNLIAVRFFGPLSVEVADIAARLHLSGNIVQHGIVNPVESVMRQMESQLLLFLNWEDPAGKGIYTQKIYEYLGARRPLIATGGRHDNDVCEQLIAQSGAGLVCCTLAEIKAALLHWYKEYRLTGSVACTSDETVIRQFDHRSLARHYAEILLAVSGQHPR